MLPVTKTDCLQEFHMVKTASAASAQGEQETFAFYLFCAVNKQAEDTSEMYLGGITVLRTEYPQQSWQDLSRELQH